MYLPRETTIRPMWWLACSQTANVVLVEDGEEEIMGLRIVGLGDPAAQRYSPTASGP